MNILLVGGTFDDQGGQPSGYIEKLRGALEALSGQVQCYNGGAHAQLKGLVAEVIPMYNVVLWFADVPNGFEKQAHLIKRANPKCLLVTSKRNEHVGTPEYSFQAVVAHALRLKANLVVQFRHDQDRQVLADVFDPLGNQYGPERPRESINQLARTLLVRIGQLRKFTRQGSTGLGDAVEVQDEPEFFDIIKRHAETFHELLNPQQTDRFLGNSSFRCARGFPSFRGDDNNHIFVSRRNVDKRYIGQDAFVQVDGDCTDQVRYWGNSKPSVDTPIQLRLYRYYRQINYMVHGHVYVEGGYLVDPGSNPIPCGAVEEALRLCRFDRASELLTINVKHHGCIVMSRYAEDLANLRFTARPAPEAVLHD